MCLRNFKFFFVLSLFTYQTGFSQKLDSIQKLDEVTISSPRFRYFNTGNSYITVDSVTKSLYHSGYITEVLSAASTLQINSYGLGTSSISARGTGESHTPVLWNGFNLQNTPSAGVDAAQLPSFFFENVNIQLGGNSALFGSGAIGGVVHLSNGASFNQPMTVNIRTYKGSFNNFVENMNLSFGNSNYAASLKIFYNKAKNNFPFEGMHPTDTFTYQISGRQLNAQAEQAGLMFNNYFRIADNQNLNLHFWIQNADKNIAPGLSNFADSSFNIQNQKDKLIRGSAEYSISLNKISVWARSGVFTNNLKFEDSFFNYSNKCLSSISEMEASYSPFKYFKLNGGINYTYERVNSSSYDEIKSRKRMALFSSFQLNNDISQVTFNIRTERINNIFIPVTFSIGLRQFYFNNLFIIHANASKNYQLPSFNDLYYYGSGNPDLKPENGLNYEAGLTLQKKFQTQKVILNSTFFHSDMNNWIRWIPVNEYLWSPFNVDKVKMEGLETSLEFTKNLRNTDVIFKGMYTYTDAINTNTSKFLSYVAKNKLMGSFAIQHKYFTFQFQETFQSKIYFDDFLGVTQSLPDLWLSNAGFIWKYNLGNIKLETNLQINNILNKNYILIPNYPMPRRNFMAGLSITF